MKRYILTLFAVGLTSLALGPASAEAGILSRIFGGRWLGTNTNVNAPAGGATAEVGRRYSYEPSTTGASRSTVPRGQSHLLPKTDPRRYIPN